MPNVLIVYHSRTGNTQKLAEAIADGARRIENVAVHLKRWDEATNDDLLQADAIFMGSPTYFSLMSAEMKKFIDDSVSIFRRLKGKKGAYFTSCGQIFSGKLALQAFQQAWDWYEIDVVGEGLVCRGAASPEVLKEAAELGEKVARMLT